MRELFIGMNIKFQNDHHKHKDRNLIYPPEWLKNKTNDSLIKIYNQLDSFYQSGVIVLGCVVQANTLLFKSNFRNCPANFIYTQDDYYYNNPSKLSLLASKLFSLKGNQDLPKDAQYFADTLQNELGRVYNIPVPMSITDNRNVVFTTLMVHRKHIPKHKVCNRFYPLIVLPDHKPDAMILPKWYWSEELLSRSNNW